MMEIAIWTTVLVTIVTLIQTRILWYFSKKVKLQDSEKEELIDTINAEDPIEYVTKEDFIHALDALEGIYADKLDTDRLFDWAQTTHAHADDYKEPMEAIWALVGGLLDAIDGLHGRIEELEDSRLQDELAKKSAGEILSQMDHINPFVPNGEETNVEEKPPVAEAIEFAENLIAESHEVAEQEAESVEKVFEQAGINRNRGNARKVGLPEASRRAAEEAKARETAPPPVEVPLKDERGEDEPMITDLRAEPFVVEAETLDGVYDIPPLTADYEIMGSQAGQRQPRQRGFRRI